MCGGSPPPPPDYSAQKGEIRRATEARYQQQAGEYNQAVQNYNNALTGKRTEMSTISPMISNLSIADLYDDPNTPERENQHFSNVENWLTGNQSYLGGLNTAAKPVFSSSVGSEYGSVGISNIPTLNQYNTNLYNNLTSQISSGINQLSDLKARRREEERRVNDARNQLVADLSVYDTNVGQLGIADKSGMDQLERELAALEARKSSFSSPIIDQLYPGGMSEVDTRISGLRGALSDLDARRSEELERIAQYEADLLGQSDSFRNTLGGYTIADEAGINSLQQQIDDLQRQSGRFSSELGFDFSQELGEISDVERQLQQLQQQRTAELNRITSAQNNYLNTARALERSAEGGNIYSASALDAISDSLRDTRADISGFSSLLPFDFAGATSSLSDADMALAALREQRAAELDRIAGGISGATQGLGDIPLYDEEGIRDRMSRLYDVEGELSAFSGGRVGNIQSQISTGLDSVNARLEELNNYRAQLEQQAQEMLENVRNSSYYQVGDLGGDQSSFDAIQAEADLYNAQQAMDEVDQIMGRLNSERQRLEADAEAVDARRMTDQERILEAIGASGLPEFQDLAQIDPMALQEFLAYVQKNSEDEENPDISSLSPTAFSNALGIIQAGRG